MHHLLSTSSSSVFFTSATAMPTLNPSKPNNNNHHHHSKPPNPSPGGLSGHHHPSSLCTHSPSATLDLLILVLVLFSGAFLVSSYFSYIFNSLSLLLSHPATTATIHLRLDLPVVPYALGFAAFFVAAAALLECCCGARSRRCDRPGCKGLKKAMEFDLQLQTEECVRSGSSKEIDRLPWKGVTESNPDYECLRAELRKMAPPNGRAVLLFRARCGCPVAKLEGWGPKKGRRHKKALAGVAHNGKGDKG
ncbi:uncharacterized protein At5g19025-like [Rhodamnia argentea]|uniref:Uncharacterized protein At5g19025-like n=1 Tax=Rhodamnia argentea TaxID=178133 RepID=A0A8B8PMR9_9MYRT|nr:uncharacterized protein At5g19025-like [Rhodamnia argentea]